jgi:hypothetical protein
VELANPSSTKLSLKLFNLNNCSGKISTSKSDSTDNSMPDFAEIGEFQLALRTLRNAATFVSPWNFSFAALENFLVNSRFCSTDLAGVDKPAVILTQFVDYIASRERCTLERCGAFPDYRRVEKHLAGLFRSKAAICPPQEAPFPGDNKHEETER